MSTFDDPNREAVGLPPIWTDAGTADEDTPEPDPEPETKKSKKADTEEE